MLMPSIFGENLLDDFFDFPFGSNYTATDSSLMKTDIKEMENGYEVTMNLPGVKKEDVKAELKDGYLTIHFGTYWGNTGIKHEVNLLTGLNADDPYEVYFKHNAHGDVNHAPGDGFVAFRLEDLLDTGGETVELTLKFDSFSGVKTAKFNYKTRVDE